LADVFRYERCQQCVHGCGAG